MRVDNYHNRTHHRRRRRRCHQPFKNGRREEYIFREYIIAQQTQLQEQIVQYQLENE